MKMRYIVIGVILIVFIGVGLLMGLSKKEVEISEIKSLYFTYTRGYAMNAYVVYDLNCDDNCILKYKPYGIDIEEAKKVKVSMDTIKKVKDILLKYEVSKWDGFDKTDKNVLDGDSFSFSVLMKNGDSIHASGYMKWPKNYGDVRTELDSLFESLF